MSIYLVRWPDLSASFVQAEGEEHLLDVLDQVGNPDDCDWSIYEGPLFIDLRLPVEWSVADDRRGTPVGPQQAVIGDIGPLATGNIVEAIQLSLADGDDGYETALRSFAWPFLSSMLRWRGSMGVVSRSTAKQ